MHSLRTKFIAFILLILITLLLLLNTYPIISSRDTVFEEKRSAMSAQVSVVSSALGGLDRLSREGVSDVLRFLDLGSFSRIIVIDETGTVIYDDGSDSPNLDDLLDSLNGYAVFRSVFSNESFISSIAAPIGTKDMITGAVALYENDLERAEIILGIQHRISILSLVIGFIALALAVLFSFLVLHRLNALTKSMHTVAGGDYSYRHTVRGKDELSDLGSEFNMLTERLETTEIQRRQFVSDASHELKTPLASIRLLSDSILQSDNMDEETLEEFVADIRNEAVRLQRTTEKLLDLSRLDDGIEIVPEPVDLKQITLDALPHLAPLAHEKNVSIHTDLSEGCVIMAVADDIGHVIFNLVENAIKYNVEGGFVLIELKQDGSEIRLSVSDSGIGIPEEERYNIFTRFYRVDKARSRASGGSGLGLSIVHDAVIRHGGNIRVGANKPVGSVFTVSFPAATSEQTGI